jgi:hypothetical protein
MNNPNPRETNIAETRDRNFVWLAVSVVVPLFVGLMVVFVFILADVPSAPQAIVIVPKLAIGLAGAGMLGWCYWHRTIVPVLAAVVMIAGGAALVWGLILPLVSLGITGIFHW